MRTRPKIGNRTSGILLLAVIAWISIAFSAQAAPGRTDSAPIVSAQPAPWIANAGDSSLSPTPVAALACVPLALVPQPTSAAIHPRGRVFLEDTTSPSDEALREHRFDCTMESRRSSLLTYAVVRNPCTSPANRQRAP
jgi:hypothetical protein